MSMLSRFAGIGGGVPPVYVEDVFSTYLYTGNGSTQTITNNIDLSGKGGMVWTKRRASTVDHDVRDSARSFGTSRLGTNLTTGTTTAGTTFTASSTGYSIVNTDAGGTSNANNQLYVSWTFRKAEKFFDVVTYTGNGSSSRSISHNLGSTPGCIMIKRTDTTSSWLVYHRSLPVSSGYPDYLNLNASDASSAGASTLWNATPTSTTFSVGSAAIVNANGGTYVAYLFAHNAGGFGDSGSDNVISCGSFDGAANTTVNLGYEPQWIMFKNTTNASNWQIVDNMRGMPVGSDDRQLMANLINAESDNGLTTITSTGFTWLPSAASNTYIYIAIRRGPMKTPEAGTEVFTPITKTADAPTATLSEIGFQFDTVFNSATGGTYGGDISYSNTLSSRLTGLGSSSCNALFTSATDAETSYIYSKWNGETFSVGSAWSSTKFIWYFLKRAPGFFDVVCYTGNSSGFTIPQSITHNLGVVPELIIIKGRTTTDATWLVGYNFTPSQFDNGYLYSTNASNPIGYNIAFFGAAPTSTTFSVTNQIVSNPYPNNSNWSGNNYVAYLFATCSGVSKVGSYTGTGTTQQINCGFTGGARFVLIKRTDSTGAWYVWDSARGIVAGNDPYLLFNSTAAEVTNTDYVDTYSLGFEISSTAPAAINANGGTFIFLAIA